MYNVALLVDRFYPMLGGAEIASYLLANKLQELNEVNIFTHCSSKIDKKINYPYPVINSGSYSFLTSFINSRNKLAMCKKNKVNILHGMVLHGAGFSSIELKKKLKLPLVSHARGSDVQFVEEINYGALLDSNLKSKVQSTVDYSNKIIVLSQLNKSYLLNNFLCDERKVEVIPNGIDINRINKIQNYDYRKKYKLSEDDFIIITSGRNKPIKRIELLFSALSDLRQYKNIKCICIGPENNLKKLIEEYGLVDRVILIGEIQGENYNEQYSKIINLYRSSNLYISTSYIESFGNSCLEALGTGLPVIVGKYHGISDVVLENQTGWIMKNDMKDELLEMILYIYKNKERFSDSSEMIKTSVSNLSWESISNKILNVYKNL